MPLTRRTLLTGLAAVIASPAIVRASSLMPIKALVEHPSVPLYGVSVPVTMSEVNANMVYAWRKWAQIIAEQESRCWPGDGFSVTYAS